MERYFILDKYNTWYDWRLVLTAKSVTPPEPKTNYINIDGMNGTLDLSESLTGEVTYKDRTITATFWTDNGTRDEREKLIRDIRTAIHGRKIKIIEPDDPTHYFYGRVKIKSEKNIIPYAEISIEATCEPWRYSIFESEREINLTAYETIKEKILNNCDTLTGFAGLPSLALSTNNPFEGSGYVTATGTSPLIISSTLSSPVNLKEFEENGYISFKFYVKNINDLSSTIGFDLWTHPNNDKDTTVWSNINKSSLKTGWNDIKLYFKDASQKKANISSVLTFRVYAYVVRSTTIGIDDLKVCTPEAKADVVINNHGAKTIIPRIEVDNTVTISSNDVIATLTPGTHTVSNLKLYKGANTINLSGKGYVRFMYREADI